MNATSFLKRQHRQVEKRFRDALKSEGGERQHAVEEIAHLLQLHTALEEQIFYPALREAAGSKKGVEAVAEAYEEHAVVERTIEALLRADLADDSYQAKVTVLKELVEHHVEEEEGELFPMAEKKIGEEELMALGEQLAERAEAMEAGGPDSED
jgi:hemerythrin superfamily protein